MARHYLLGNRDDRRVVVVVVGGGCELGWARGERPVKRKQANRLGAIEHD